MKDHKLVPLRPPESILAVVRKAYGNATAYDVGHVWHEIYTRLPDAAPVQEPAAEILSDVIHRNAKKLVFTHHGLSLPVGTKLYTATQPAPVQEPDAIGCKCSVCGEWQRWTPSGMVCKNGHGGADGINHRLYTAPQPVQELRALEESRSKAWAVAKSLQTQVNILLPVVEAAADNDDEYGIGPTARKALDALAAHKET